MHTDFKIVDQSQVMSDIMAHHAADTYSTITDDFKGVYLVPLAKHSDIQDLNLHPLLGTKAPTLSDAETSDFAGKLLAENIDFFKQRADSSSLWVGVFNSEFVAFHGTLLQRPEVKRTAFGLHRVVERRKVKILAGGRIIKGRPSYTIDENLPLMEVGRDFVGVVYLNLRVSGRKSSNLISISLDEQGLIQDLTFLYDDSEGDVELVGIGKKSPAMPPMKILAEETAYWGDEQVPYQVLTESWTSGVIAMPIGAILPSGVIVNFYGPNTAPWVYHWNLQGTEFNIPQPPHFYG